MPKKKTFFNKFSEDFDATDLIAIVIIVGGFILLGLGIDTVVGGVLTMTAGFFFGTKSGNERQKR